MDRETVMNQYLIFLTVQVAATYPHHPLTTVYEILKVFNILLYFFQHIFNSFGDTYQVRWPKQYAGEFIYSFM